MPPEPGPADGAGPDLARSALARARADARRRAAEPGSQPPRATGRSTTRSGRPRRIEAGEEPRSGPGPDERDPQPVGRSLRRLLRERGWETRAAAGGIAARWSQIVGPEVAEHVRPEAFEPDPAAAGRLVLRADSTAWATQVRLLLPHLRARIDAELGRGVVRDITVVGPAAPTWSAGPRRVRGRGPRDTYG